MIATRRKHVTGVLSAALIFSAPLVWLVYQQGLATLVYFNCRAAAPPWSMLIGLIASAACATAAFLCWRRQSEGRATERFLLQIGAGAGAIFGLAALAMTAALALAPSCAR